MQKSCSDCSATTEIYWMTRNFTTWPFGASEWWARIRGYTGGWVSAERIKGKGKPGIRVGTSDRRRRTDTNTHITRTRIHMYSGSLLDTILHICQNQI